MIKKFDKIDEKFDKIDDGLKALKTAFKKNENDSFQFRITGIAIILLILSLQPDLRNLLDFVFKIIKI